VLGRTKEYLFLGFYNITNLVILFFAKIAIYIAMNHDKINLLMINDFKTNENVGV